MKKYEYKTHYLKLDTGKPNEEQIVDALNQFGGEGWRLNRLYGDFSLRTITSWKGGVNLLLEREISRQQDISFHLAEKQSVNRCLRALRALRGENFVNNPA